MAQIYFLIHLIIGSPSSIAIYFYFPKLQAYVKSLVTINNNMSGLMLPP